MSAVSNAQRAKHSSESVEWFTPPDILERARLVMGGIDLDPASCALANTVVKAKEFRQGVGFPDHKPWRGRVWLNPPGGDCVEPGGKLTKEGRSAAKVWWRRLVAEYRAGHIEQAMFLGFNLDCLQTTQDSEVTGDAILDWPLCIPSYRIPFLRAVERVQVASLFGPAGETEAESELQPDDSPTQANVIVYLPPRHLPQRVNAALRFERVFSDIGRCKP